MSKEMDIIDLKKKLKRQIEFYFSRENLASDTYLVSKMNSEKYVPVNIIASFKKIKHMTTDLDLLIEVMRTIPSLEVNENGTLVRPIIIIQRTTLIIREMPDSATEKDIRDLFAKSNCGDIVQIRSEVDHHWFVTFKSEPECLAALKYLQKKTFNGKELHCRIKSENILRNIYAPPLLLMKRDPFISMPFDPLTSPLSNPEIPSNTIPNSFGSPDFYLSSSPSFYNPNFIPPPGPEMYTNYDPLINPYDFPPFSYPTFDLQFSNYAPQFRGRRFNRTKRQPRKYQGAYRRGRRRKVQIHSYPGRDYYPQSSNTVSDQDSSHFDNDLHFFALGQNTIKPLPKKRIAKVIQSMSTNDLKLPKSMEKYLNLSVVRSEPKLTSHVGRPLPVIDPSSPSPLVTFSESLEQSLPRLNIVEKPNNTSVIEEEEILNNTEITKKKVEAVLKITEQEVRDSTEKNILDNDTKNKDKSNKNINKTSGSSSSEDSTGSSLSESTSSSNTSSSISSENSDGSSTETSD